jgi:hypothetical protein
LESFMRQLPINSYLTRFLDFSKSSSSIDSTSLSL